MNRSLLNNLAGIGASLLMVAVIAVENLWVKFIAGGILITVLIVSFIMLQKNKELSPGVKRLNWFILIPLFSLIGYLYQFIK
ncbi:MAG: hypothetical protein A2W93_00335 [Bacteroidetes bacterium GWF2_43_63]|nr:MAG: hypothetical protein A2W94_13185 [Bacteroidetes bacterium GWE2_42_42]OFY53853.1 MAG: hypothetical protein A2W93_00335 [Bacteroidetes bacterium GWF2_43_63]HBG69811.1 hypothetical protein [Bacteroidales bacterium]HCB60991.1 hypothetical protein [Bacteroidales bacterium]HCY24547.1 hypothetical protein [Bacteroidales bacterium]